MSIFEHSAAEILFMYFIFCNIGWVQESIIESTYHHKLINRGFLKGPYIPIYGCGGLLLLLLCLPFRWNGWLVYIIGIVSCTFLEFSVGILMEKVFRKQFWDYSMLKFVYKNRISLISSLFWGLMALVMVYLLYGLVTWFIGLLPPVVIIVYDCIMGTAMSFDTFFTIRRESALKKKFIEECEAQEKDEKENGKEDGENCLR